MSNFSKEFPKLRNLGNIYEEGKLVKMYIDKAIYY